MLKLNESYSINDGQGVIVFSEGKKGTINANYEIKGKKDAGTINGTLSENILKGTYHNSLNNSSGIIEFQFTEKGFNCKWKQGLEPGPMRGKWEGKFYPELPSKENSATEKYSEDLTDEQKRCLEEGIFWRDFDGDEEDQIKKKSWLSKKSFLLESLKQSVSILKYAPEKFKADKTFILEVVKNTGGSLKYASENLKKDREIVLAEVSKSGHSLEYATDNLKNDREIVLAAVSNYGLALEYASDNLKTDREIVLSAVSNDGRALEYASDNLKTDREIVLSAVSNKGAALQYASDNLKADREIVLLALKNSPSSIQFLSSQLNNDPEIALSAVKNDGLGYFSWIDSTSYHPNESILFELAEKSSIGSNKVNFKVRDLVHVVGCLFQYKLRNIDPRGEKVEQVCNEWFDFNQIIYKNQIMDGEALLSLAQVQFEKYRPIPTDGRDVDEYTRDLLNEAIDLNDDNLDDIITYGLCPEEYVDFLDLTEKACELLWNRSEKSYADVLRVISTYNYNDEFELRAGISEEFAKRIIKEAREVDSGNEEDKENFEKFVSEIGLE